MTPPVTGPDLGIRSLPNLRDLGGHRTADGGRVRSGLLYRSTDLSRITDDDVSALARLGIRVVYDLRTEEERGSQPDRLPTGAALVPLDVLRGSPEMTPAELRRQFADPQSARRILGGERGLALWQGIYRKFVTREGARAAYGRLFTDLADEANRPALVHCTTGKDRTGWATAALLLLLGVPEDLVMDEYLLSARYLGPRMSEMVDAHGARSGDLELPALIASVRPGYLGAALEAMRASFGSIERYFEEGLGVEGAMQRELRAALVERG